jgi:hypothetical protein
VIANAAIAEICDRAERAGGNAITCPPKAVPNTAWGMRAVNRGLPSIIFGENPDARKVPIGSIVIDRWETLLCV